MNANAILTDRFDKVFEFLKTDHQAIENEAIAGINEEIVRKEEALFIQDVKIIDIEKTES